MTVPLWYIAEFWARAIPKWVERLVGAIAVLMVSCSQGASNQGTGPAEVAGRADIEGPVLTVLSYNVYYKGVLHRETLDVIRESNADAVFLQETTPEWERILRDEFADEYPHMQFKHCCRIGGLAVLSRYPITERDYLPSPIGKLPAWRVIVEGPFGPVEALNVHLKPTVKHGGNWLLGYFATTEDREAEIKAYAPYLEPSVPSIVLGDFNEDRIGRALQFLESVGFRNAIGEFAPNTPTWSEDGMSWQLDHVLYDSMLRTVALEVIEGGGSDHFAVRAEIGPSIRSVH